MCNLSSQTKAQDAIRPVFDNMGEPDTPFEGQQGGLPPMAGIFPAYPAPIIRRGPKDGWPRSKARCGMPMSQVFLSAMRAAPSVTNHAVALVHPKAMPVIVTTPEDWRLWRTAPAADALRLQRPVTDGMLQIVAEGVREDAA